MAAVGTLLARARRLLGASPGAGLHPGAVDPDAARRSIAIWTVHRAGSMFVYRLTRDLCRGLGLLHRSVNGGSLAARPDPGDLRPTPPACYGPIRYPPAALPPDITALIHLRDPRDVLTSLFYSHTFSHSTRGGFRPSRLERRRWAEQGIDAWVLERADGLLGDYSAYVELLGHPAARLLLYETMVTDFDSWVQRFLEPFALREPTTVAAQLVAAYADELRPVREDRRRHRRQVAPGDHRDKLTAATRRHLDRMFADVLSALGCRD